MLIQYRCSSPQGPFGPIPWSTHRTAFIQQFTQCSPNNTVAVSHKIHNTSISLDKLNRTYFTCSPIMNNCWSLIYFTRSVIYFTRCNYEIAYTLTALSGLNLTPLLEAKTNTSRSKACTTLSQHVCQNIRHKISKYTMCKMFCANLAAKGPLFKCKVTVICSNKINTKPNVIKHL